MRVVCDRKQLANGDCLCDFYKGNWFGNRKSPPITKNPPKSSQEFSEHSRPFLHKLKGLNKNSPPKVHPSFAQNLGRQILGNTFSGPK